MLQCENYLKGPDIRRRFTAIVIELRQVENHMVRKKSATFRHVAAKLLYQSVLKLRAMFFSLFWSTDDEAACSLAGFVLVGRNVSIFRSPDTRQYEKYFLFKSSRLMRQRSTSMWSWNIGCGTNGNFEKMFLLPILEPSNYKVA